MLSLRKTKTKTATKDMQKAKSNSQKISSKYNFWYVYFSDKPFKFKGRVAILISATTDQTVSN